MIIVSRFNEDLSWIKEYPFNQFEYIVYNKGKNDRFEKKNVVKVIPLPNIGRCDHTYLYHIVNQYDALPPISIFLPGSINMEKKKKIASDLLITILEQKRAVFFYKCTTSIFHTFKDFSLSEWVCRDESNKIENNEKKLYLSPHRPFGKWFLHQQLVDTTMYCKYGIFSLDKRDIVKNPITKYKTILDEVSVHSNPEVGHYIERSWASIFGPFHHTLNLYYEYPTPIGILE
jgi:hypothetical protein